MPFLKSECVNTSGLSLGYSPMDKKPHDNQRYLRNTRALSTLQIAKGNSAKSFSVEKAESEQIDDIGQDSFRKDSTAKSKFN